MAPTATPPRLRGARKAGVLLLPWLFLALFGYLYVQLLLPRALQGQLLAACMGIFAALVFVSFAIAALTFTRDVLADRYP